jgi:Protein of unknown function (DUF2752)
MMTEDFKKSLRIVWLVLSLGILTALTAPFLLGRERVAHLFPVCEAKAKYGRECSFCGMTTSFLDLSEGDVGGANRANHGGIPLYLAFVSNEGFVLALAGRKGVMSCKH